MELKYVKEQTATAITEVLIVPLWNWNGDKCVDKEGRFYCSNRTFMELKYVFGIDTQLRMAVLIVPLWNWNIDKKHPLTNKDKF